MLDNDVSISAAITRRQIQAAIQPVYNVIDNKWHAIEALARLPDMDTYTLITTADRIGMGHAVSLQVLELVVASFKKKPTSININFSPNQLLHKNVVKSIEHILTTYQYPPYLVTIELTEAPLDASCYKLMRAIRALKDMSIRLSLDDFGVEGQSVQRVIELPLDQLKLDRVLITDINNNPMKQDIVSSIIQIATKYGIEIVCEGVETKQESDYLTKIGGHLQQGWLWAKPILLPTQTYNSQLKKEKTPPPHLIHECRFTVASEL